MWFPGERIQYLLYLTVSVEQAQGVVFQQQPYCGRTRVVIQVLAHNQPVIQCLPFVKIVLVKAVG